MSIQQLTAVQMVLVTALVTIEHDREKHVPGIKSGPEAETFLVPEHVSESLIKVGAVKPADVVDADALLSQVDTNVIGAQTASSMITTFADVADMVEADKLRAELANATAAHNDLIEQLAQTQEQLAQTQEQLAHANSRLADAEAQANSGKTGADDAAALGTTTANDGDQASTDAGTAEASAQTVDTGSADASTAEPAKAAAASARRKAS